MQSKLIAPLSADGRRTFAIVLETGEEFTECFLRFAKQQQLTASQFTAIGAFSRAVLGYFEWDRKEYRRIPIDEQVEVVSLLGDIALKDGVPSLHPHVTVSKRDGSAWGGHLLEGIVRPTLEIIVNESPATLARKFDAQTGLALITVGAI
jgi:uncharacterized protein